MLTPRLHCGTALRAARSRSAGGHGSIIDPTSAAEPPRRQGSGRPRPHGTRYALAVARGAVARTAVRSQPPGGRRDGHGHLGRSVVFAGSTVVLSLLGLFPLGL